MRRTKEEYTMRKINGRLYLVVDPKSGIEATKPKVDAAIRGGVDILQIWDHWDEGQDKEKFINEICNSAHGYDIPVLINENLALLDSTNLDGIHFDRIPDKEVLLSLKESSAIVGITCENDLSKVDWAIDHDLDYISFCAMFPSPSDVACEIVSFDTVRKVRKRTGIPIFASGGITPGNAGRIMELGVDGIAVISGVLKSDDPEAAARNYKNVIESYLTRTKT